MISMGYFEWGRQLSRRLLLPAFCFSMASMLSQQRDTQYLVEQDAPGVKKILIDNRFWVWTRKIGDGKIPVLLLHGGPGQTHEYFEIFSKYLPPAGITIYYYDQFGSNYSQQPTRQQLNDPAIWTISRYVEEVEQVRKGLHLNRLFIYGHSYGALLGLAYTSAYPDHVQGLIFSDMNPYQQNFGRDLDTARALTDSLLEAMPAYKGLMHKMKDNQPYDTILYDKAFEDTFTRHFVVRSDTLSDALIRTKNHKNEAVAELIGPSTFSLDYPVMIRNINTPTLLMSGKYDFIIRPKEMAALALEFKNATYSIAPNGSHIPFVDDSAQYFPPLIAFIKKYATDD